jgi:hypothetical protein
LSDLGCAKVPSPSGTEDGWVGFWRKSINVWAGGRTVGNSFKMDPSAEGPLVEILWQYLRTGCHWQSSLMLNELGDSGLHCVWRNVQLKVRSIKGSKETVSS